MINRVLAITLCFFAPTTIQAANCPFCTAVSQTLRQEMAQMDVAVIASFVSTDSDSTATFAVKQILHGAGLVAVGDEYSVNYFGKAKPEQLFLLMGIEPPDFVWSSPRKTSEKFLGYIAEILKLPKDDSKSRLEFYLKHLGEVDPDIARDVFDEFASASYTEMLGLKDKYDRERLLKWIQDTELSPDLRKLYMVMLGICGLKEDAAVLEKLLLSEDANKQAGLDALIACYLTLKGESGLPLINEKYLANKEANYSQIYSTIMALRFHGTEGGVIDKKMIASSMQLLLDRPKLADLVISDLARWEDWGHVEKLVKLFKESEDSQATWLRIPVFNYLKACPLPEAAKALEELKELDPANYKRAIQFFLQQQPSATDSSYYPRPAGSDDTSAHSLGLLRDGATLAVASSSAAEPAASPAFASNRFSSGSVIGVVGMVAATFWVGMWLTITGAGRQPQWFLRLLGNS